METTRHREEVVYPRADPVSTSRTVYSRSEASRFLTTPWTVSTKTRDQIFGYQTRECDDVVTPNFHSRIARGEIINNDFDSWRRTVVEAVPTPFVYYDVKEGIENNQPYSWGVKHYGNVPFLDWQLGDFLCDDVDPPTHRAEIDSLIDQAVTEAHANASSAELQSLTTAAEARKTVDSIGLILQRAYRILRAVKKADLKYLKRQISKKELSDRYMELRYAVRPLVYDAIGIINALEKSKQYESTRATARGFKRGTYTDAVVTTIDGRDINRTQNIDVNVRAGVLTDVKTSMPSVWGLDQIAETALELVPFSFVAGWFADIGNKVAALSPSLGVRQLASWVSVEEITFCLNSYAGTRVFDTSSRSDWTFYETWSGSKSYLIEHKYRIKNPSFSVLPNIRVNLDTLKIIDLAKMFTNIFR